ncbi:MAG: hypothetical protein JWL90_4392 [Chthoniobacteraceae bacterium]|nr:hypothetical protein [Chthoniobacteraceae bacterium]
MTGTGEGIETIRTVDCGLAPGSFFSGCLGTFKRLFAPQLTILI